MRSGVPLICGSKFARKLRLGGTAMAVKNIAGWDTHHDWMIRDKDMDSGSPVMLHQCRRCGRNFVMELLTGDQYAVQVGAMRFSRLSEETTSRWLAASCPGERLESDQADLETRVFSYGAESRSSLPGRRARRATAPATRAL